VRVDLQDAVPRGVRVVHRGLAVDRPGVVDEDVAIDDFGTGYSSMAYLRQFPVDALKIDRAFISGIAASKESAALVHTLVQLGKTLELETLGEGIEEPAQLRNLQREQCDSGQGFLFARPLPPAEIERFLDATPSAVAERTSP
jgi:EAL domain-containing protein (putative c-di-GMP-specific phosphodiesterase class I)